MMVTWYFVNIGNKTNKYTEDEAYDLSNAYYNQRTFKHKTSMFYNTYWLGVL